MTFDEIPPSPEFGAGLAEPAEIKDIRALAARYMPIEASEETIRKVQIRSQSILAIRHGGKLCGGAAALFLNKRGLEALLSRSLEIADPSWDHLSGTAGHIAAIYIWAACGPGGSAGNAAAWFQHPACRRASIFARPATGAGLAFLERLGFVPSGDQLWIYRRAWG